MSKNKSDDEIKKKKMELTKKSSRPKFLSSLSLKLNRMELPRHDLVNLDGLKIARLIGKKI
jgi:hypothetical protein